ncbi:hypothetical protein MKX03_021098 [Papaver bracteatum]|nr:hypothetical protein MKX03_021098 [Papaver bracteatum]
MILLMVIEIVLTMCVSEDVLALASLKVDHPSVEPGSTMTFTWRGKAVFIRRCTRVI